jgi:hypothetical protein
MGLFGSRKDEYEDTPSEDEGQEDAEEPEDETYEVDIECSNCKNEDSYYVPVGTKKEEFLKDKKCDECGCYLLGGDE